MLEFIGDKFTGFVPKCFHSNGHVPCSRQSLSPFVSTVVTSQTAIKLTHVTVWNKTMFLNMLWNKSSFQIYIVFHNNITHEAHSLCTPTCLNTATAARIQLILSTIIFNTNGAPRSWNLSLQSTQNIVKHNANCGTKHNWETRRPAAWQLLEFSLWSYWKLIKLCLVPPKSATYQ